MKYFNLFKITNQEIEQSIKNEMSGDLEDALLALGKNFVVFSRLSCCLSGVSVLLRHSCSIYSGVSSRRA